MKMLALLLALITTPAFASDTATLILSGIVPAVANLTVTPNGTANTTLDIVNGTNNLLVATAQESCNTPTGYKINIKSQTGGLLVNATNANLKTTYTLSYGGQQLTLTQNYQQAKNVTVLNSPAVNVSSNINVSVAAYAAALAGTYSDTVTLQIVANP